jgi:methionyl-tRNA formyltransferase
MRVAFLGNDAWSVAPLRALVEAADIDVDVVVTNPPRPAGRGSRLTATAVADAARAMDVSLLEVDRVRDGQGFDALDALEPDAIVVVAYGEILTPDVLDIPRLGTVNLHLSVLPRWRGAAPVQRAILAGDGVTGVTVMLMDEGLDTGPIVATQETTIGPDEEAGSLGQRLSAIGGPLLVHALRGLDDGSAEARSQDHAAATYAPKLLPDERTIDWTHPADAIVRRVRAFAPEPGAVTEFRRGRLKIVRATAQPSLGGWGPESSPMPARVSTGPDGRVFVEAGAATRVELLEVAPAGRKQMTGAEWARGARIQPSEHLG